MYEIHARNLAQLYLDLEEASVPIDMLDVTAGDLDLTAGDVTATDDFYYFTVDTNTATSGGVSGGGNNCTAGPATLEA